MSGLPKASFCHERGHAGAITQKRDVLRWQKGSLFLDEW
jgi:hypothetical protein